MAQKSLFHLMQTDLHNKYFFGFKLDKYNIRQMLKSA